MSGSADAIVGRERFGPAAARAAIARGFPRTPRRAATADTGAAILRGLMAGTGPALLSKAWKMAEFRRSSVPLRARSRRRQRRSSRCGEPARSIRGRP